MKKNYVVFGFALLIGLPVAVTYAAYQKQDLQQIASSSLFEYSQEELGAALQEKSQEALQGESQQELLEQKGASSKGATKLVPQKCWSARKCRGKVMNNLNSHQCKTSGGKSWNDNQGQCFNL